MKRAKKRKPNTFVKNPCLIGWQKWLNSRAGQSCMEPGAFGEYLQNRLWRAFMAGWNRAAK